VGDLQLRCVDQISLLFRAIGAPRELKCHLKWGLRLTQTLCLPLRAAHFLLKLSDCYLLCDDEVATEALLQGVDHIIGGKTGKAKEKSNGSSQGFEEVVVRLPGQPELQAVTASPSLLKPVVTKPDFLFHPSSCSCFSCKTPPLHVILMKLALHRAAARDMAGDGGSAMTMVNLAMEMVPSLMAKTRAVNPTNLENLRVELVEGLQGRLESLGCRHAWEECRQVMTLIKQELDALPMTKIKALPELMLRTVEQERFLDAAERREKEIQGDRKEKELTLAGSFSKLQLDIEQSSTPEASSRTVSRVMGGAPSKRTMPSIGVGDPSGIAKDLEKLGLVSEQSPIPTASSKQVKEDKKKANPRISCLDQLGDMNLRRVAVPKLTLTEGTPTPKKFFKSGTPLILSTPAGKASSKSKPFKLDPAVKQSPTSKGKQFKSPRSAKENTGFGIYEDGVEDTPSQVPLDEQTPATGRGSRASARRKENLAASASKSKEEALTKSTSKAKEAAGSTTKLPRMAALPEAEAVGRQPSRRKAALKRL